MTNSKTNAVESASEKEGSSSRISIQVEESGDFFIDGKKKEIDALKPELLEQIVDASLDDLVDYEINGEKPIASFFQTLMQGTGAESELRKVYLAANDDTAIEESANGIEVEDDIDAKEQGSLAE